MVARDLATGEKTDQRYIPQRTAHDLQFGTRPAEMRAAAAGATDVDGAGNTPRRVGRRTFSKDKPIFHNPPLAATKLLQPPYGALFDGMLALLRRIA